MELSSVLSSRTAITVCVVFLLNYETRLTEALVFPVAKTSIAHVSDISASPTCSGSGSGFTCDDKCPTRTAYPQSTNLLVSNVNTNCDRTIPSSPSLPAYVNNTRGPLQFAGDLTKCPSHAVTNGYRTFTLSVWLFTNCSKCQVLSLGPNANVTVSAGNIQFGGKPERIGTTDWVHLAITESETVTMFVNGVEIETGLNSIGSTVTFGPGDNLTTVDEVVAFVDAKIYNSPLTVREISEISTGKPLLTLPTNSQCRCPDSALHLVKDTVPIQYLKCQNKNGTKVVSRLNPDTHPAMFMTDLDTNTHWNSGLVRSATVTLKLGNSFQLSKLTLKGLQNIPDMIVLMSNGQGAPNLIFQSSCGSDTNCKEYNSDISSTKTFTYDFEDGVSTRIQVSAIVGDMIRISFASSASTFFTVSELELDVKCHCYGNDANCKIVNEAYTCSCSGASHTVGKHCDTCTDEYYRLNHEDLTCPMACDCNMTGSRDNVCEKVGGKCTCKANVDPTLGRQCVGCKHNTVKFGSDLTNGCTQCSCNSGGIVRCESNHTCTCKKNVETSSSLCQHCAQDYYNISRPDGCAACGCDMRGTKNGTHCDKTTGQCQCRSYVEGRTCSVCKDEFYNLMNSWPTGCVECGCNFVGSRTQTCDKSSGQCPCTQNSGTSRECTPTITSITPLYGPLAGGTVITIMGYLLGNNDVDVTVSINDTHQTLVARNESFIEIETNIASWGEAAAAIAIAWTKSKTGSQQPLSYQIPLQDTFAFKKNPDISVPQRSFQTYASGGCSMDVEGTYLTSVYQPELMVYDAAKTDSQNTKCSHSDATLMTCRSPNVTSYTTDGELVYGFRLDGVSGFRDLDSYGTRFVIIPDPVIDTGKTIEFRNTFDKDITITGQRLNAACDDRDVSILIGGEVCPIKQRTNDSIVCDPGEDFPGTSREEELVVHIGNLAVVQGIVRFKSFWSLSEFIAIVAAVGAVVLIVIFIVCICWCRRRRNSHKHSPAIQQNGGFEMEDPKPRVKAPNNYTSWPKPSDTTAVPETSKRDSRADFMSRLEPTVSSVVKTSVIDRTQIEPGQHCTHKGQKVRVISGQFSTAVSSPFAGNALTIKTLVSPYPDTESLPSWLGDGLKECTRLQNFINENVLRMLGIAIDSKQVYILYPEMAKRTLKDYLISAKQAYENEEKLDLCVQVLEGMNFLASEACVHRDLAARNCWVSKDNIVKIADSSFAYDIYPTEYLFQNGRHQPVRWMAPESLRQAGFYSSKSDVWSFGVLMWEVFTNGYLPYSEVTSNSEIPAHVCEKGYRLGKPHECPENAFNVLGRCHADKSDERPSFPELLNMMTDVISGGGDESNLPLYQNRDELSAEQDSGMELYENTSFGRGEGETEALPPVPPKPKRR